MARLKRKHEQGLWFWLVDWEIVLMQDQAFRKAIQQLKSDL
jgi:hypothetical protein